MTHAWLIIAHNEFGILQRLIAALDAPECDFYVHIDKKVRVFPELKVSKGRLFILNERVDVRWGHVSQIQTELLLLETALKQGPYEHYHIISGEYLDFILNEFNRHNSCLSFKDRWLGNLLLRCPYFYSKLIPGLVRLKHIANI